MRALRWIAVLPAATVAAAVVTSVLIGVLSLDKTTYGGPRWEGLAVPFFQTLVGVYLGAKVAPSHRVRTALVLGAVILVLSTLLIRDHYMANGSDIVNNGWLDEFVVYVVLYFGLLVGAVFVVVRALRREVARYERAQAERLLPASSSAASSSES